jgi:DNA polymerase
MILVGPSGKYLRSALKEVGVNLDTVRFTNIVRCRPPNNKVSKKAINECYNFTLEAIAHFKPKQVWLMGNTPLNAVLGESGITNWNGSNLRALIPSGIYPA